MRHAAVGLLTASGPTRAKLLHSQTSSSGRSCRLLARSETNVNIYIFSRKIGFKNVTFVSKLFYDKN
jgi:hypothetical protein